ncbi:hypothetical protein T01_7697 [Trichinella spiralis]|uniref:Uncharacterized protein n=1 Tax=Trichinella spiralis TaxID=6334 RepID=A0A0V1ALZ0_TRISP|nr:hypothetical protein T01_7697 [Trichinella spiralis]
MCTSLQVNDNGIIVCASEILDPEFTCQQQLLPQPHLGSEDAWVYP